MEESDSLSKIISSLAFIKVRWDKQRKDYIDIFVPFFATLVSKREYKTIPSKPEDLMAIANDFKEEFGLIISYYALISIIRRAEQLGLLERRGYELYPTDKIYNCDLSMDIKLFERKYEKILKAFSEFANSYDRTISMDNAEKILIGFLKKYDLEIVFLAYGKSSLPQVNVDKKDLFLFSKYVEHLEQEEPELFQYLVDIAIGHSLTNIMNYGEEINKISKSSLRGVSLYLDTPFILRLIGAEGEIFKKIYSSLVKDLNEKGANLYLFQHTYEEINNVLQDCYLLIDSHEYDPLKAFPVLRYFKEIGYHQSDVEIFINKIEDKLREYNISIKESLDPNVDVEYQIDMDALKNRIIEIYGLSEEQMIKKDETIYKDVKSISFVYKLRSGNIPRTLNQAKHIFVTTNSTLAYASRKFEGEMYKIDKFYIPITITDVFLGTILWINKPKKLIENSKKRLLAKAYASMTPTEDLLTLYIKEINKLREHGDISEEDYILLRDSLVAKKMLTTETLGDPNNFTPQTPIEILAKLREELKKEAEQKLQKERKEHEKTKEILEEEKRKIKDEMSIKIREEREKYEKTKKKLEKEKKEKEKMYKNIDMKAEKLASFFSWLLLIIFIVVIISSYLSFTGWLRYVIISLSLIPTLFGLFGITVKTIKKRIKDFIIKYLGLK